jgi:hypothetical protein
MLNGPSRPVPSMRRFIRTRGLRCWSVQRTMQLVVQGFDEPFWYCWLKATFSCCDFFMLCQVPVFQMRTRHLASIF